MGPNGVGKTTLLNLLLGLVTPVCGVCVCVFGVCMLCCRCFHCGPSNTPLVGNGSTPVPNCVVETKDFLCQPTTGLHIQVFSMTEA